MIYRKSFYLEAIHNTALMLGVIGGLAAMVLMGKLITDSTYLDAGATMLLLLLQLLKYLPQLLTASLFAALVVTFNRMTQTREMAAWSIAGLRRSHWLSCSLTMSLPTAVTVLVLALYSTPWSIRYADEFQRELSRTVKLEDSSPGIFGEVREQDLVFHLGALSPDRSSALNIFIARSTEQGQYQVAIAAKAATGEDPHGLRTLKLDSGHLHFVDFRQRLSRLVEFGSAEFLLGLENLVQQARRRALAPTELDSSDASRVELLWRLGFGPAVILLAILAFSLGQASPGSGKGYQVLLAVLSYWLYSAVAGYFKDLGINGELAPAAAASLPLALLGGVAVALALLRPARLVP